MTTPIAASEKDLRSLAGMVSAERTDVPEEGLPLSLLFDLMDQIRCDYVQFNGFDSKQESVWFGQQTPDDDVDEIDDQGLVETHWKHYWDCQPCSYPDRTGDLRSILTISDFYSAAQWHSSAMYCEFYKPQGLEHELQLCLPASPVGGTGPQRTVRLYLFRGPGSDFSERDRAILTLLRPHLLQAFVDNEHRRNPVPELTPRQWDLLRLMAAGHTNSQIARQLGLSEGTVRTHLENIYSRLQVQNRTAAVIRAFPDRVAVA